MGSNWKNIFLSLFVSGYSLAVSLLLRAISKDLPSNIWFALGVSGLGLVASLVGFCLYLYFLIKIITDLSNLHKQFPEEKINLGVDIVFLLLLFVLEFPFCLNVRDRILKKNNQFVPFISKRFFTIIIVTCFAALAVLSGALIYAKTQPTKTVAATQKNRNVNSKVVNMPATDSEYNDCFYLVKSSERCALKTSIPVKADDVDQDNLIDHWEDTLFSTNPTDPDSNDNGLTDGQEFLNGAFSNTPADWYDSDSDGLFDSTEAALGLDDRKKDTDKDGYADGDEIIKGYDPLSAGKVEYKYDTTKEWVAATPNYSRH